MIESAQQALEELRTEFSDDVLRRSLVINDKVSRLGSKKLEYFNELLGITDDVGDRVWPLFESFRNAKVVLEVEGFMASVVASAVKSSDLPEHEKLPIIDIYLDLWTGGMVDRDPSLNGTTLRGSIDRMWQGTIPGILRAAANAEAVKLGFPNPPLVLARALDQLCGVHRSETAQIEAGAVLKDAIIDAMLAVRAL
ncbi:hypothetical protein FB008_11250 [Sinorhizobium medicae]|nr:hypothetical protein [Sinorhizobium medicae]TWA50539.1 hypothetical protein FB008_11250 [Sinorhizobium medicae]